MGAFGNWRRGTAAPETNRAGRRSAASASGGLPLAFALEPRFMFDAAGVAAGGEADAAAQEAAATDAGTPQQDQQDRQQAEDEAFVQALAAAAPPATDADRTEIVVIDTSVKDYQSLVAGVAENREVVVLDGSTDALAQIATSLQGRSGVDALHIVSHGRVGGLIFGAGTVDAGNLSAFTEELQAIGAALAADGDIPANSTVFFTDHSWKAGGGFTTNPIPANPADGTITWTAPGSTIAAGTILHFNDVQLDGGGITVTASSGPIGTVTGGLGNTGYSGGGEALIIYQTTNDASGGTPTFIYAFANRTMTNDSNSDGWSDSGVTATTTSNSALPGVGTGASNVLTNVTSDGGVGSAYSRLPHSDNLIYNGPTTQTDKDGWLSRLHTTANWLVDNSVQYAPGDGAFGAGSAPVGAPGPANTAPGFTSASNGSVNENAANGTNVVDIDAATGLITVQDTGDIDFESGTTSYVLTIQADDGGASNNTTTTDITVSLTDDGVGETVRFESMTAGKPNFESSGQIFPFTGDFLGQTADDYGSNLAGQNGASDGYADTGFKVTKAGHVGGISAPAGYSFRVLGFDVWPSSDEGRNALAPPESITVIGKLNGVDVATATVSSYDFGQSPAATGGAWQRIDLTGTAFLANDIDTVEFKLNGSQNYLAIDNFVYDHLRPANAAPEVDLNGGTAGTDTSAAFVEGNGPVAIALAATVTEADGDTITTITVTLTNDQDGAAEGLSVSAAAQNALGGISSASDITRQDSITIAGASATQAEVQAFLRAITYDNISNAPNETARTVEVVINDGTADSTTRTSTVSVSNETAAATTGAGFDTATGANLSPGIIFGNGNETLTIAHTGHIAGSTADGGGGADTLVLSADGLYLSGVTVTGFETLEVGSGNTVVMTEAQHDAFTTINGVGTNTIAISAAADGFTGDADIETYILDAANLIILGSTSQNVIGSSGNDTVSLDAGAYTGTLVGGGGADTLVLMNGSDISGATVTEFQNLTIADGATVTMSASQLAQFTGTIFAVGTQQITVVGDGDFATLANIETYSVGDDSTNRRTVTIAQATTDVSALSASDEVTFDVQGLTYTGTIQGEGTINDIIRIGDGGDISGATLTHVERLSLADDATATLTSAQYAAIADQAIKAAGTEALSIVGDGDITINSDTVEMYVLGDDSTDTRTVTLAVDSSATFIATAASDAITLDLASGGTTFTGSFIVNVTVADTVQAADGSSIADATLSGFTNLTLTGAGATTLDLTPARLNSFSGTITAVGTDNTLRFDLSGTLTGGNLGAIETLSTTSGGSKIITLSAADAHGKVLSVADTGSHGFVVTGAAGAQTIAGSGGDDSIDGGAGADVLGGGSGADSLTGGTGDDTFTGSAGALTGDTITDLAVGDVIELTGVTGLTAAHVRFNGDGILEIDTDATDFAAPKVTLTLSNNAGANLVIDSVTDSGGNTVIAFAMANTAPVFGDPAGTAAPPAAGNGVEIVTTGTDGSAMDGFGGTAGGGSPITQFVASVGHGSGGGGAVGGNSPVTQFVASFGRGSDGGGAVAGGSPVSQFVASVGHGSDGGIATPLGQAAAPAVGGSPPAGLLAAPPPGDASADGAPDGPGAEGADDDPAVDTGGAPGPTTDAGSDRSPAGPILAAPAVAPPIAPAFTAQLQAAAGAFDAEAAVLARTLAAITVDPSPTAAA